LNHSSFKIINASAGSGKTTSLVYHFLLQLFLESGDKGYRKMLALTFTNKAVNEMKKRILQSLYDLGYNAELKRINKLKQNLSDNLGLNSNQLKDRSQRILKKILHEYAAFEIITLDSFTNKIIRSFARDLKLPTSYDLIIDSKQTFQDITNRIIEKVGTDKSLTQLLVSFSISKVENHKSWDIGIDLNDFSKILLNENNRIALSDLRSKRAEEFLIARNIFLKKIKMSKTEISKIAKEVLKKFSQGNLEKTDFIRGTIYNYFDKYSKVDINKILQNTFDFDNRLFEIFENGEKICPKSVSIEKKDFIDRITAFIREKYMELRMNIGKIFLLQNLINQWTTLSLLGQMEYELQEIQNEKGEILLERFNEIIAKVVLEQPVIPFIYEKLGVRYRHYFIDEFQDTSKLQWNNLTPLISDSLESLDDEKKKGSLLLVGDPKQAIYGWRGGDNFQFLQLLDEKSPFQVKSKIDNPKKNYRSFDTIVSFNDDFFNFINEKIDSIEVKKIFKFSQKAEKKNGGYVEIKLVEKLKNKEDRKILFINQTIKSLKTINKSGFQWGEIAILTRTRKEVVLIANALKKDNIPFISSESLSISESRPVSFLIALIRSTLDPNDIFQRKEILEFLWQINSNKEDYHKVMSENLYGDYNDFFKKLNHNFKYSFDSNVFRKSSIYEAIEYAIESFNLNNEIDAYLNAFLDDVFDFSSNKSQNFATYMSYWEESGSELSIPMPEGNNCVKINTIHKSKGLQFSVVILPFLEEPLNSLRNNDKVWYPIKKQSNNYFNWGWVNFSKKLKLLGDEGEKFYENKVSERILESLNILYVSLTRAINNLYLICPIEKDLSSPEKSYSTLINQFLIEENKTPKFNNVYCWGEASDFKNKKDLEKNNFKNIPFQMSINWQEKLSKKNLQETLTSPKERNKGVIIHDLLSKIKYKKDVKEVVNYAIETKKIRPEEERYYYELITKIICHPQIKDYFNQSCDVFNEQDILIPKKSFIRPDRIVKTSKGFVVIDYKTGTYKFEHENQLSSYEKILTEMGHYVFEKYLVYIGEKIEVRSIKINS